MGVFKWLRRERVTVTTSHVGPSPSIDDTPVQVGTIRTEEYKRDLAEFQARRSSGSRDLQVTPVKKKCARHSLPVSCTDCTGDPDTTFNYEKKSAIKYKKKSHKRTRSAHSVEKLHEGVPNIQFLFQNQVFMPGNMFATASYSEPRKTNRHNSNQRSPDFFIQKHIDFKDDQPSSPPFFFKNNSLPFDTKNFLDGARSDEEEVDGVQTAGDVKTSSSSSGSHKNDSCEEKLWEVMSELKHFDQWADEQLQAPSLNTSKSDDSKSDVSTFGLPIASACNLNVTIDKNKAWSNGKWGVVPVQIKKLAGVTIEHVKKKQNMEINILRKYRHPNIILLMGLYPDVNSNIHIICERCIDTLFAILHVQGRILSVQTSVHYALDIANALVFLHMQGYLHTELSSMSVMISAQDTAKLSDLGPCTNLPVTKRNEDKGYEIFSTEPQYANLSEGCDVTSESEPLLSQRSSEAYLSSNAVSKHYKAYSESEHYRWQAPELFEPDEDGFVHPCSKSDVYSLSIMLWECCNAAVPWQAQSYGALRARHAGGRGAAGPPPAAPPSPRASPRPAALPAALRGALRAGLAPRRAARASLAALRAQLLHAQRTLDEMEYIIIPDRLSKNKLSLSTQPWDTTSPTDSDYLSPKHIEHKAEIHTRDSSNDTSKESSPLYETIRQINLPTAHTTDKCFISSDEDNPPLNFDRLQENECSSACSTPLAKLRARINDVVTPGTLHRSDSTEYCSILSPDTRLNNFGLTDDSIKDQSAERPTAKLSRSFTPKSYKPLHIKVPEFKLDSIKPLLKEQNSTERSSYNFNIKNYSLPNTPIARSNKLRKNAWLSGELNVNKSQIEETPKVPSSMPNSRETKIKVTDMDLTSAEPPQEKEDKSEILTFIQQERNEMISRGSTDTLRDSFTGLRRVPPPPPAPLERARSLGCVKGARADDALASVYVKPLVAIHERWIHEASRKTGRSMSLPEDSRSHVPAVKPASHCVDTRQAPRAAPPRRRPPRATAGHWEQYCQAREAISKSMNFPQDTNTWIKASEKGTITEDVANGPHKIDRSTDTLSIEEFIRDLIRKEFHHLVNEITDNTSESTNSLQKGDDILNKGVANILESLKTADEGEQAAKKDTIKSFSRVKINGNNKPLLQITFNRSGENSLQVLDNCVNVTICDSNSGKDKLNLSMEDTLTGEDIHINSLKRCQAFSAIQEARSTEDLYIDDDLSTHMQENFGGRVKLIPLHGSLHEILCEKADDCCLVKVKQENGCDTIYFRCDNSDTESRDAVDGSEGPRDTVVFKRSISLIEERFQRVFPKDKRPNPVVALKKLNDKLNARPKSEIFIKNINRDTRVLSNSTPSLFIRDDKNDEVELNIENVLCYQDSSSDECLKCQVENDDFEMLEREIEEDIAKNINSLTCGCLEKISEENLSVINEDNDKN
ncbi:uncharacterized protein LOC126773510 [Nymphalis io]|uniref:uncharacterized protein LOC126773510 n=1 Tax=Inachis io TaxID=171585 RepID=UPI0021670D81|nr:uncharacterized protein LOC126773510 [Nymphalis io]